MKIQIQKIICVCLVLLFAFGGCGGVKAPDNFPEVAPLTVFVTDGGKPLEEVFVVIEMSPSVGGVSITAKTDASGKAIIKTSAGNYSKTGSPIGKAIMTLFKEPVVPDWKTPEELGKMEMHEQAEYQNEKAIKSAALPRIIPPNLTDPKTSTLTKEIIKGQQNEWNVNIGSRE